ncbi:MAG: hypothetical protein B6D39_11200 [Anaerolineae bacterium UTCFX2]|jgi:CO/xanthine dehydrogenase FAD-binding subunit|nr:FAD binding domain-containing protein [Anaerolineales bacterium]OQY88350.1 MAG: hypothetical protein B6D39_11200 [Anaerolineae bacterium UTCFX2]
MIVEYHRPTQLKDALDLLSRPDPLTIPIGGGSAFRRTAFGPRAVVDLQALGLDTFEQKGNSIELGATLTLQNLLAHLEQSPQPGLAGLVKAIRHEAAHNLRQVGSVAGCLVSAAGRSPFGTALLALDGVLTLEPGAEELHLGDLYPVRDELLRGRLITAVSFGSKARIAYEYVARSPADQPIVCAAVAVWHSGRTRLALGGFGTAPRLAFDGPDSGGVEAAARSAYSQAEDAWASKEYRAQIAGVLAGRAVQSALAH